MTDDLIPETGLAAAIAEATGKPCPKEYPTLANYRRSGKWPATQIGVRWFVRRDDLPKVLTALGLTIATPASKGARRARAAA